MKEWVFSHLSEFLALIVGGGTTLHPRVRKWLHAIYLGVCNRSQLVVANIRLNDNLSTAQDDALYWKDSREDLDAKYDDLTERFRAVREQADAALHEIVNLKSAADRRKKLLTDFCADRDSLLLWGRGLMELITSRGIPIPVDMTEPHLATASFNANILT